VVQVAPPEKLVAHMPLDYIWQKVVVPHIAERHKLTTGGSEGGKSGSESEKPAPNSRPSAEATAAAEAAEVAEFEAALDAATEVGAAPDLGPEEDVLLDDDDEEVHTVTDDDDVFDDLLDEGSDTEAQSGRGVKRTAADSSPKKDAIVN